MSAGYVIAKENFKEAVRHVNAESEPALFNLLSGLQSLTDQIEADFAALRPAPAPPRTPAASKAPKARTSAAKKTVVKKTAPKKAVAKKTAAKKARSR